VAREAHVADESLFFGLPEVLYGFTETQLPAVHIPSQCVEVIKINLLFLPLFSAHKVAMQLIKAVSPRINHLCYIYSKK